jgi:signal transduction histidine kinase
MEEALRQAERLEALNQAAAGIAHEIRNPIASIRASAQELQSTFDDEDARRFNDRLLQVMVTESDRLNRIVTDFLDYARLREASLSPCDLAQVLDDVVLLLGRQAGEMHAVTFECSPDVEVEADREQLMQVFLNLGLNGLEAMGTGGSLQFEASVSLGPAGDERAVISVRDQGGGIAPEAARQMFEPFFTTKARGTGMGLPIVKRIVESHGGRITVESGGQEEDGGTVFRVELPLEQAENGAAPPAPAQERPAARTITELWGVDAQPEGRVRVSAERPR